ncbi:hypothetical protein A2U01_0091286, partial [Trifolium medium]|nr:hypothetical protein [Trifolium medium]
MQDSDNEANAVQEESNEGVVTFMAAMSDGKVANGEWFLDT